MGEGLATVARQPSTSLRIPNDIVEKVRQISALQGREMTEIIAELLGPPVDKLWRQEAAKLAKRAAEKPEK